MRSKSRGQFADIRTHIAALIVDTQYGGAMRMQYAICNMQCAGVANDTIASVLRSVLGALAAGKRVGTRTN
jgi:hypothetical protein